MQSLSKPKDIQVNKIFQQIEKCQLIAALKFQDKKIVDKLVIF